MKTSQAVVITAIATFLLTSGLWLIAFVGWQAYRTAGTLGITGSGMSFNAPFAVTHRCPPEVNTGDRFDLVLEVTNTGSDDESIESIDLYHSFLDGFTLSGASFTYQRDDNGDFETLWVDPAVTIPAGGTETVTITLEGSKTGTWSGDVDVCDPGVNFTTVVPNVEVLPAAAP